jgi:hypothetical protein
MIKASTGEARDDALALLRLAVERASSVAREPSSSSAPCWSFRSQRSAHRQSSSGPVLFSR